MIRPLERFAGMRVLVVDDNAPNIQFLQGLLADEGLADVFTEQDPRRVQGRLPHLNPDLVLLDLHMPHLDGHAVLAQVVRFAAGTYLPVLVLTADTTTVSRNRALEEGARDFLTKPLDATETILRVANLLETREAYTRLRRSALEFERQGAESELERSTNRRRVERVLRQGEMRSYLQPIVDLTDGQTVGFEALSRFSDAHSRGPAGWFSDAFEVGLGVDLELQAVALATSHLAYMPGDEFLAVNLSPASILDLEQREPLCPENRQGRLVVELTEHVPVEDYGALHRCLIPLRDNGARLAADDVGAGYAGFRHLVALSPDIIKLDISLVHSVHRSHCQRALTRAIVAFAADVGATVLAEGVEEEAELDFLHNAGVTLAQGYYLGRPALAQTYVPAEQASSS